jgi:Calcineurin-like phosphoesterase
MSGKGKSVTEFAQGLVDEAKAEAHAAKLKAEAKVKEAQLTIRNLERDRQELLDQFNDLTKATRMKPVRHPTAPKKKAAGDFVRVIIPDVHAATMDRDAVDAFFKDLKQIDPDEIVLMGDLLEAGGFLAGHQTLGYVAQTEYNFQDDVNAANWFLDEMAKAAPRARVHFVEGNHDDRMERWVIDQVQRHQRDAEFLMGLLGPEAVLKLSDRGIAFYGRGKCHMGLDQPGLIKLGKIFFVHELSGSKNAAAATLSQMGGNVNYAHTHREDTASLVLPGVGLIKAWNAGCLTKRQPLWRHSNPTNWSHGFAIEFVTKAGTFLHVNIPIWDGKSLMGTFLNHIK